MKRLVLAIVLVSSLSLVASECALVAADSKLKDATNQVERGVKSIPDGKVGKGRQGLLHDAVLEMTRMSAT